MNHIYVVSEDTVYSFGKSSVISVDVALNTSLCNCLGQQRIRKVEKDPIFYAGIAITNACNLTCKHCSVLTVRESSNATFWEPEQFWALVYELYSQGLTRVSITGGEPFLHPNINSLYDVLGEFGIESKINTNGLVADPEKLSYFIERGLNEIDISLNSIWDDSGAYVIPNNTSSRRLEAIRQLSTRFGDALDICASSVLTNHVTMNLAKFAEELKRLGVRRWRLRELLLTDEDDCVTPGDIWPQPNTLIKSIQQLLDSGISVDTYGYLYNMISHRTRERRCINLEDKYIYISFDGTMYWMHGLGNSELGVWPNTTVAKASQRLTNLKKNAGAYPRRCGQCCARLVCIESPNPYSEIKTLAARMK